MKPLSAFPKNLAHSRIELLYRSPPDAPRIISDDGRHIACLVNRGENESIFVLDGVEDSPCDRIRFDQVLYTHAGAALAYVCVRGGKARLRWGGVTGPGFDAIGELVASADRSTVAYSAVRGPKVHVVHGDAEGRPYDAASGLMLSATGRHCVYRAWRDGAFYIVFDGSEWSGYDHAPSYAFSPDEHRFVAAAVRAGGAYFIDNGLPTHMTGGVTGPFVFSNDGARLAFAAQDPPRIVLDGREMETPGSPQNFVFSPDGRRLAYTLLRPGGHASSVVDNVIGPSFAKCTRVIFSPDSRRTAHFGILAETGRAVALIDGEPGPSHPDVDAQSLVFSPDGQHVAYTALNGAADTIYLDREPLVSLQATLRPLFSDDGAWVACAGEAMDGSGESYLAINGELIGPYPYRFYPNSLRFRGPRAISVLGHGEGWDLRVEISWPP